MSHFCLSVITDGAPSEWEIEEILEPYRKFEDKENPNGKFFWYEIGGRYGDSLCIKREDYEDLGYPFEPDFYNDKAKTIDVNCAKIKNLIFPDMEKDRRRAKKFWREYVEGKNPDKHNTIFSKDYFLNYYQDKKTYVEACSNFCTFAIITKDGAWYANGEAYEFGITEGGDPKWYLTYKQIVFDNAADDDYITIIDCHT